MTHPAVLNHAFVGELENTVADFAAGRATCTVMLPVEELAAFNGTVGLPPRTQDRGKPGAACRLVLLPTYGPSDPAEPCEVAMAAAADALIHLLQARQLDRSPLRGGVGERLQRLDQTLSELGVAAESRRADFARAPGGGL
ncbi:hypothetical protein [Methylobacterium sp. J-070]|uniref:hypothetical protein n=1 Tax=Methylobacterium sp. J-070 TaxID=2836650 RepID=UPI001FB880B9|nr:hypothetical protein [Methylobacterium sp. J-070]MCJ2051677.1 hypothetical protein [Methylobacterium sp. J-070]